MAQKISTKQIVIIKFVSNKKLFSYLIAILLHNNTYFETKIK